MSANNVVKVLVDESGAWVYTKDGARTRYSKPYDSAGWFIPKQSGLGLYIVDESFTTEEGEAVIYSRTQAD